ncbi:Aste57867_1663 [Aphanomyces stellatus]|uniref:Protein cereblon n=1 Tax=Aphanomyces stellatus TaxID=120398 RepID=A0A485K8D9_9STRA|nr:hypothetical protein As57867_001661 [Aphanomyces stellatus]VFT78875.1 Aste57867_1663 [Aphanomyces stellatus]
MNAAAAVFSSDEDDMESWDMENTSAASSSLNEDQEDLDNIDPFVVDHSYLGDDMAVMRSKSTYFTPGTTMSMPLVLLPDLVIFPGETLPLRMLSTSTLQLITTRLRDGNDFFALINTNHLHHVGTVIQIERVYEQGDMHLSIVGRGRQRFELVERVQIHSLGHFLEGIFAQVRILPDYHAIPSPVALPSSSPSRRKRPRPRMIAYWGPAQYALFDGPSLVYQAKSILLQSVEWHAFTGSQPSTLTSSSPSDPTRFSYWLAAHLNLSLLDRQRFLATSCAIGRLRALIAWLQQQTSLIQCAGCATTLADTRDIFLQQDAVDGSPVSTFVNPHGSIHQILTMHSVPMTLVRPHGEPTLADTWFPGYTWQCISCRTCANFLGWRYEAAPMLLDDPHPRVFFGLLRNAIC